MSGGSGRTARQVVIASRPKRGREEGGKEGSDGLTEGRGRGGGRNSMCGGIDSVTAARRNRFVACKKLQGDLRER